VKRAELRRKCRGVRRDPGHARRFSMPRAPSSTERGSAELAARDPSGASFILEFAVLDTRLNDRLSGWMRSFVWAPTGQSRMARRLCSNVV